MDVVRAGVLHLAVDVVPLRDSALPSDQRQKQPDARTISELRRLALYTKGDFPDIAHTTDCVSFVEHAYAVKTKQSNVPKCSPDAIKVADAILWRVAAQNEITSMQDHNVYSVVPRSAVPPRTDVISSKWILKIKPNITYKARLVPQGWNQVPGQDCGSSFAPDCNYRALELCLPLLQKTTGRFTS